MLAFPTRRVFADVGRFEMFAFARDARQVCIDTIHSLHRCAGEPLAFDQLMQVCADIEVRANKAATLQQ